MTTPVFPNSAPHKSFDGSCLFCVDGGSTVWAFPNSRISLPDTDNIGRPDTVDANVLTHHEILGLRMGSIEVAFFLAPDRNVASFLNAAFGARTGGQLAPMVANIKPHGAAGVRKMSGIWWRRFTVSGKFSASGQAAGVIVRLSGVVLDVDNFYGAPTLAAPATSGLSGAGLTSFNSCSLNDSAATPNVYDGWRGFALVGDNGLSLNESTSSPANRISSGCTPSPLRGVLTLDQLDNATNPLPQARGHYPFSLLLPTGDGTHTMKADVSTSRDGGNYDLTPTDFIGVGQSYSLFGTSTANTTNTAGQIVNFTYV